MVKALRIAAVIGFSAWMLHNVVDIVRRYDDPEMRAARALASARARETEIECRERIGICRRRPDGSLTGEPRTRSP